VVALQASTIGSNGGAHTAQDNDFWLCHLLSPLLLIGFSFSCFHLTFSSLHC
jgi:hypothetical protein